MQAPSTRTRLLHLLNEAFWFRTDCNFKRIVFSYSFRGVHLSPDFDSSPKNTLSAACSREHVHLYHFRDVHF